MVVKDDVYYFNIGDREIYFYRDEEEKRNYFGLTYDNMKVYPNFGKDAFFEENPEHYLAAVFAFLEQQSKALDMEA